MKLSPGGKVLASWGGASNASGQLTSPGGIAVDKGNDIDVLDAGDDRIHEFSSSGVSLAVWGSSGFRPGQFHLESPNGRPPTGGLALDPRGRLVVTDSGNQRIQRFTPNKPRAAGSGASPHRYHRKCSHSRMARCVP